MADEVDVRVSLGFDPDAVLGSIDGYDEDTISYLSSGTAALNAAYSALRGIHDAKAAAEADQTMNRFGALLKTDDYARARMSKVWPLWETAETVLNKNVRAWEAEMSQEVTSKASERVSTEIRSHFKALSVGERGVAIHDAIIAGDETVVTAVLGAPAMLSGFDEELKAAMLREWHERTNPAMAKRLRASTQMLDAIQSRVRVLRSEVKEAVGALHDYEPSKVNGAPILVRTWTPDDVRARKKAADAPFTVGL